MTPDTSIGELTVAQLLDAVAAKQPTPGGGTVAAVTVATAAALGEMVVRYRIGKKAAAGHKALHEDVVEVLGGLRSAALSLAETDAVAFRRLSALWKLDPDDPARQGSWVDAVAGAIDAPLQVMTAGLTVLDALDRVRGTVGTLLRSDLAIAALLAQSGSEAAAWNVRINLPLLGEGAQAADLEQQTARAVKRARSLREQVEQSCRD
jgi:formiminotetrahydrofolate cyclodeaminase